MKSFKEFFFIFSAFNKPISTWKIAGQPLEVNKWIREIFVGNTWGKRLVNFTRNWKELFFTLRKTKSFSAILKIVKNDFFVP